ncbi:MAG: hypothetical protein WDO17_11205 [Alphaproteobacteria bacterium]
MTNKEAVHLICTHCIDLAAVAKEQKCTTLYYLLSIAALEAAQLSGDQDLLAKVPEGMSLVD